jgi:hypothetical protein
MFLGVERACNSEEICDLFARFFQKICLSFFFGLSWAAVMLLVVKFHGALLCWMGSYLTGRKQQIGLEDYLSGTIQCYSGGVPNGSHLNVQMFLDTLMI